MGSTPLIKLRVPHLRGSLIAAKVGSTNPATLTAPCASRLLALLLTTALPAQWDLQPSHTTASLRGIHALGGGVAWASGTEGTVLRTTDDGLSWQRCPTPPAAEHLDFRGIQAFDRDTALVMSSGKGDLSRLYKTTDGCQTWKLVFTNPDKDGFWDAVSFSTVLNDRARLPAYRNGIIIGDPVNGKFVEFFTTGTGEQWHKADDTTAASARNGENLFAASNSSLISFSSGDSIFVTAGKSGSRSRVLSEYVEHDPHVSWKYVGGDIPLQSGDSAGAFSVATSHIDGEPVVAPNPEPFRIFYVDMKATYIAVGGDYKKPDNASGTAAISNDGGLHWKAAQTPPHGYRSAVAYSPEHKAWITVGPNGTDLSTDDGRNWRALKPGPAEPPDADKNWNALSLPFAVGPKGRIGRLRPDALPK